MCDSIQIMLFSRCYSILISHLEEIQLIIAQGSTNWIQPRTGNRNQLAHIITLTTDFFSYEQVSPFSFASLGIQECFSLTPGIDTVFC